MLSVMGIKTFIDNDRSSTKKKLAETGLRLQKFARYGYMDSIVDAVIAKLPVYECKQ